MTAAAIGRRGFLKLGAAHPASQVGTHKGGYFSFQPLWDSIVAAEPDLLD